MGKNETYPRLTVPVERAIEHCRVIVDGHRKPGEYRPESALREVKETGQGYVWLALHEPDENQMSTIAEQFNIHELIVEDAVSAHQRPKVERYDDQLFIVVRSVQYNADDQVTDTHEIIETGEIQMLLGPDFIITMRHGAQLPNLLADIDDDPEIFSHGPAAVAWRVADYLVDQYVRIASQLSIEVDELEETVFTPGTSFSVDQIYLLKREILEMRHATDPLAPALLSMTRDNKDIVPKQIRSYLRDVLDNELVVKDLIGGFDERLTSLIDASVAKVSMQQNQDMRTISAFVGMAAVPTLIAGIYGMNFENMPELHYQYGYFIILGIIVLIIMAMWMWFRKNHWL